MRTASSSHFWSLSRCNWITTRATKCEFSASPVLSKEPLEISSSLNYSVTQWFYKEHKMLINCRDISTVGGVGIEVTGPVYHFLPALQLLPLQTEHPWNKWARAPRREEQLVTCTLRWRLDPGHFQTHQSTDIFSHTRAHSISEVPLTGLQATAAHSECGVLEEYQILHYVSPYEHSSLRKIALKDYLYQ